MLLPLLALAVVYCVPAFASGAKESTAAAKGGTETLYYVPKFTDFVYFQLAQQGAQKACDELGVKMVTSGPPQNDVQQYVQDLQNLLPQNPQIVVTTSSDANAPVPILEKMRANGAVVVAFDSDVGKAGRNLYINIAPYKVQAEAILDSALANNPKGGNVIWMAPSPNITDFNEVKKSIDNLIATVPKYKNLHVIDTLYMQDDPNTAYSMSLSAMEAHPHLAGFISASGMANPAVNKAIDDTGRIGKVYSTGAALPSTMTTYIKNGTSKEFDLWSPYWYGYMAAWVAIQAKRGKIQLKDGATLNVPHIGKRTIYNTPEGLTTDLSEMVFFRPNHDTFQTAVAMTPSSGQ